MLLNKKIMPPIDYMPHIFIQINIDVVKVKKKETI